MSLETALLRLSQLNTFFAPQAPPAPPAAPAPASAAGGTFAQALQSAQATNGAVAAPFGLAAPLPAGGTIGQRALAAARAEVGQAESPPGSNNSPRIAQYRSAVPGGPVGPWCAYFVSWCAKQAGAPVGENGQGFASVDALYAWAQRSGRAFAPGSGQPQPGDLVVWDEHIGIVEGVLPDGRIQTIEGNSSDRVSQRVHAPNGPLGFVRLG